MRDNENETARRPLSMLHVLAIAAAVTASGWLAAAEEELEDNAQARQKEALAEFNPLVGGWRGTGQPRRGSAKGAWRETAEWVWDFEDGGVALRYDVEDGKLFESGRLTYDVESEEYALVARIPGDVERSYTGKLEGKKLVLVSDEADDEIHRLTVTHLNEKRMLVLHEKRSAAQQTFFRVAEVGYTRKGTRLASSGTSGPECIVTGGEGTMTVTYKGKTYYVCCSGCRQAFEADPEGIIAEAAERRAKEREDAASKR